MSISAHPQDMFKYEKAHVNKNMNVEVDSVSV